LFDIEKVDMHLRAVEDLLGKYEVGSLRRVVRIPKKVLVAVVARLDKGTQVTCTLLFPSPQHPLSTTVKP
jgi:hypothetical protein